MGSWDKSQSTVHIGTYTQYIYYTTTQTFFCSVEFQHTHFHSTQRLSGRRVVRPQHTTRRYTSCSVQHEECPRFTFSSTQFTLTAAHPLHQHGSLPKNWHHDDGVQRIFCTFSASFRFVLVQFFPFTSPQDTSITHTDTYTNTATTTRHTSQREAGCFFQTFVVSGF